MQRSRSAARRSINGIFILDKPAGVSSNTALQMVKRRFSALKAGHTGSLDPVATGVLPILFGEATKFSQYLIDSDKSYFVRAKLGVETTTGDCDGEILLVQNVPPLTFNLLRSYMDHFRGAITQIPPMFSAVKQQGKHLYELARKGLVVDRKSRDVNIYFSQLTAFDPMTAEFEFHVKVSKGTYIRTLVEDIGKLIGCGAHLTGLRRLTAGFFDLTHSHSMDSLDIEAADVRLLYPLDLLFKDFVCMSVCESSQRRLMMGQALKLESSPVGLVALFSINGFFGLGEGFEGGVIRPRRLMSTQ